MKDVEISARYVCADCIEEAYLKREIKRKEEEHVCDYCDSEYFCYTIWEVAGCVERAFSAHYERTSADPSGYDYAMMADKESDYEWERSGDQAVYAIMDAIRSTEEIAEDIRTVLKDKLYDHEYAAMGEEGEFEEDAHYERKHIGYESWQTEWNKFELTLKTESRYFNKSCINHLESVFADLSDLRTSDGRPVIAKAGPGTDYSSFYRARVFHADDTLKSAMKFPASQLGPPPALVAAAGRMNARGISVFYGANTPTVALAEVRPPVGCKVAVARFELTGELRLLDLSALQDLERSGSIFDDSYAARLEKAAFLENLSRRIIIPVMPGSEDFDYLATQAIADFLASNEKLQLDGILFSSVQAPGRSVNVVLFHKASRVQEIDLPKGGKIEAELGSYGEEGWEPFYRITELIPRKKEKPKGKAGDFLFDDFLGTRRVASDPDTRRPALKIDLDTIEIHEIESVTFKTIANKVYKSRLEDWEGDRGVYDD